MKKIHYDYCSFDLLKNPKKYQMSPFLGSSFLVSFKSYRISIMNSLGLENTILEISQIPDFFKFIL